MSNKSKIPNKVLKRLTKYHRYLDYLMKKGTYSVSSSELACMAGITPALVRRDICYISKPGGVGQSGCGYRIKDLYNKIGDILDIASIKSIIIIGAGCMGKALLNNKDFQSKGFNIIGIFDSDESIIGEKIKKYKIMHLNKLEGFTDKNQVDIAALTMQGEHLKAAAEVVTKLGIKALWNFSPTELKVKGDIAVENVCLIDSLSVLGYKLKELRESQAGIYLSEKEVI